MMEALSEAPRTLLFDSRQSVPGMEPPREIPSTQNKEKVNNQESRMLRWANSARIEYADVHGGGAKAAAYATT